MIKLSSLNIQNIFVGMLVFHKKGRNITGQVIGIKDDFIKIYFPLYGNYGFREISFYDATLVYPKYCFLKKIII